MTTNPSTPSYSQPSGTCTGCAHGLPYDAVCLGCEADIVAGLVEASAERTVSALELLAQGRGWAERGIRPADVYRPKGEKLIVAVSRSAAGEFVYYLAPDCERSVATRYVDRDAAVQAVAWSKRQAVEL